MLGLDRIITLKVNIFLISDSENIYIYIYIYIYPIRYMKLSLNVSVEGLTVFPFEICRL